MISRMTAPNSLRGALISADLKLAGRLDARFFALLEAIEHTGSINRAARTAGLSYKGAWLMLDAAGNLANAPLLHTATGGSGGGGTQLTDAARDLLGLWRDLQSRHADFLREQDRRLAQHPAWAGLLRRLSMRTSARNQFAGTIVALDSVATAATFVEVTLRCKAAGDITATLSAATAKKLKLKKGTEATALIKASSVVFVTDFAGFRLSSGNQLAGTVSRIERGAVSSLVVLTLPGGAAVTGSITNEGVEALALAVGSAATAVFESVTVALAVPG